MKRICVFTGTRADYGLLYWLMQDILHDTELELQTLVSGSHLSPELGLTYRQIVADGFNIDAKVDMLLSADSAVATAKSMGLGVMGYADALSRLAPDALVILGDRYEALAAAQTALLLNIPIIHLHGGEITEGAYDDALRHAITKLSYLHFTSTEPYRQRVIQLGEAPERVFNAGAIGLDHLSRSQLMTRAELAQSLDWTLHRPYFVVTYHPVTWGDEDGPTSMAALLAALDCFPKHQVILTYPNADEGGRQLLPLLEDYAAAQGERVKLVPSLGQTRYLSAIKYADAVIGNSSSGIIEVPAFNVGTVNIGVRQQGRLAADSVLHCQPDQSNIQKAIQTAIQERPHWQAQGVDNPYGKGSASKAIIKQLKLLPKKPIKTFHDLVIGDK
ncbi:UDP-N,N'-diacetylbacillosamine 2-epimerase (hydrolyzing) [Saliniradius amylolyticus]|uniref:UDP-N,N'-diacetylbacillosamine 2-epimerase (Hydrolyzing) n=1 Tax=Saliniradius amylolyticus TaxID=2183582 RepID=A0A2S2E2Z9_9ALTE|nr:UDP-N-acetylglucosamine 2-epimerase [Saliniradius amylolyticus]AWL11630.1 UDP-N,N'-diacetylbacillosamine 2-epimerase (hydrolyzing) [Saliniradius amylolyticus]